jgi:hypothetical protein
MNDISICPKPKIYDDLIMELNRQEDDRDKCVTSELLNNEIAIMETYDPIMKHLGSYKKMFIDSGCSF